MDCALVRNHLDSYVDGELEPSPAATLETHLHACTLCRDELLMSRALKRAVHGLPRPAVSEGTRADIVRALDRAGRGERGNARRSVAFTGSLAVAAAALLAVISTTRPKPPPVALDVPKAPAAGMGAPTRVSFGLDDLTSEVIRRHTDQPPIDIQPTPDRLAVWLSKKLGFRVQPVEFTRPDVRLVGAGVTNVGPQPAALLNYTVGSSAMSVVVFQPTDEAQRMLHQDDAAIARSGGRRVRVGSYTVTYRNVRGYTVPMIEQDGLVYAFASDLDERSLLQLIGSSFLP